VYECLIDEMPVNQAIIKTEVDNLYVLPSHIDLVGAEIELLNIEKREHAMVRMVKPIVNEYDFILIDCSPSLGLITVNALTASNSVIIPVQSEYFALEGISKLLNTIKIIKSRLNPNLEIEGFLITMFDNRLRSANQVYTEVKKHFADLVFDTVIHRNVRLSEAPSYGKPISLFDPESRGTLNYVELANELSSRY
jgi:chromosome partitioning protein